jgi:hypothetical protein
VNRSVVAANATPLQWETFFVTGPATWPLTDGYKVSLAMCSSSWNILPEALIRPHSYSPPPDPTNLLVTKFGGEGNTLYAGPILKGYPEEYEHEFVLIKVGGSAGPTVASGDLVSIKIEDSPTPWYFAVTSNADGARLICTANGPGTPNTTFKIEIGQAVPGVGWRPPGEACQRCAGVHGIVRDAATGSPIAGATVSTHGAPEGHEYVGRSAADGTYALSDKHGRVCVPAGQLRVVVEADRHRVASRQIDVPASGAIQVDFDLECTTVSGAVRYPNGQPVAGVPVLLLDRSNVPLRDASGRLFTTYTRADGSFSFECVPHGDAVAVAQDDGHFGRTEIAVTPDGVSNVLIVLPDECGSLIVNVVDEATGAPIASAKVAIVASQRSGLTNAEGNAEFAEMCVPGEIVVLASADGYKPSSASVVIRNDGSGTRITIQLRPLAVVGEPPSGSVVTVEIVLTWSEHPRDLDSHLAGPGPGGVRFHCFYRPANQNPVPYVRLTDVQGNNRPDDRNGQGPELIRVEIDVATGVIPIGTYTYWVHNYSGATFEGSDARVALLVNGVRIRTYKVADAVGEQALRIWRVFTADIGVGTQPYAITDDQTFVGGDQTNVF